MSTAQEAGCSASYRGHSIDFPKDIHVRLVIGCRRLKCRARSTLWDETERECCCCERRENGQQKQHTYGMSPGKEVQQACWLAGLSRVAVVCTHRDEKKYGKTPPPKVVKKTRGQTLDNQNLHPHTVESHQACLVQSVDVFFRILFLHLNLGKRGVLWYARVFRSSPETASRLRGYCPSCPSGKSPQTKCKVALLVLCHLLLLYFFRFCRFPLSPRGL